MSYERGKSVFADAIQDSIDREANRKVYEVVVKHVVLAPNVGAAIKLAVNEPTQWPSSIGDVKEIR